MTRPLRIEFPGAFYHVISRGSLRLSRNVTPTETKGSGVFWEDQEQLRLPTPFTLARNHEPFCCDRVTVGVRT